MRGQNIGLGSSGQNIGLGRAGFEWRGHEILTLEFIIYNPLTVKKSEDSEFDTNQATYILKKSNSQI